MAYINHRKFIAIDINEEYNEIGRSRISKVKPLTEVNKKLTF